VILCLGGEERRDWAVETELGVFVRVGLFHFCHIGFRQNLGLLAFDQVTSILQMTFELVNNLDMHVFCGDVRVKVLYNLNFFLF